MKAITHEVNKICRRYLDNSRLALLPPPPSTPFPHVNVNVTKNARRKMEDRHAIILDMHTIFDIKVKIYRIWFNEQANICRYNVHFTLKISINNITQSMHCDINTSV